LVFGDEGGRYLEMFLKLMWN